MSCHATSGTVRRAHQRENDEEDGLEGVEGVLRRGPRMRVLRVDERGDIGQKDDEADGALAQVALPPCRVTCSLHRAPVLTSGRAPTRGCCAPAAQGRRYLIKGAGGQP